MGFRTTDVAVDTDWKEPSELVWDPLFWEICCGQQMYEGGGLERGILHEEMAAKFGTTFGSSTVRSVHLGLLCISQRPHPNFGLWMDFG